MLLGLKTKTTPNENKSISKNQLVWKRVARRFSWIGKPHFRRIKQSVVTAFILSSIASLPLLLFIQIDPDQKPLASVRKAQKVQVILAIFYLILGCTLIFINTSKPALKDFVPYIGVCALYLVVGLYIWEKEILKNQKHA